MGVGARVLARSLFGAVLVVGVVIGLLWALQRQLIYLPRGAPEGPASDALPGAHDVVLTTSDGLALAAWHVPASEGAATVLVAPGNAGHRGMRTPLAAALAEHGLGVLLVDYRGYAGNPGTPSAQGLALDVRAARTFLLEDAGVTEEKLLYYGESLGAAVVVELATEHPPAGLVLRSPFTSLADVAQVHFPFLPAHVLLRDRYPLAGMIASVEAPTVVVLGTADSIVPPDQSRRVASAAAGPTRVVEVNGAGHNDAALLDGPELVDAVLSLAPGCRG